MGDLERILRKESTQLASERQYFDQALLRIIEQLGPLVASQQANVPFYHTQIKPRIFLGLIIPARADWHHEGKSFWNVSQEINDPLDADRHIHWILFSDGELHKVHYAIQQTSMIIDERLEEYLNQRTHSIQRGYRTIPKWGRLANSTDVHAFHDKRYRIIQNGYLSLREFALKSGISAALIEGLECDLLAPKDLRQLNGTLKYSITQPVLLPVHRYLRILGISVY